MGDETKLMVNINDTEAGYMRESVRGVHNESEVGHAHLVKGETSRDASRELYCFVLGVGKHGSHKTLEVRFRFFKCM